MKRFIWLCLAISSQLNAQIPNLNDENRLDVATWNIEWFGHSSSGPSNEETQLANATKLLVGFDFDIVGVCEISDVAYWNKLLNNCSDYQGVLSTWNQTQKTGLLFKKDQFDFIYQKHILPNFDYEFASGRLPLEVGLMPKRADWNPKDTLRVWVLHMKANTGSSSSKVKAYNRRYNAGVALKMYIDRLGSRNKGLVLGDWNDDFDESILSGYATPFSNWLKDTNYTVLSYPLSLAGKKSTVSYNSMIDHIVATPGFKDLEIEDSTFALYCEPWISGFGNNTSDHYPISSRLKWPSNKSGLKIESIEKHKPLRFRGGELFWGGTRINDDDFEVYSLTGARIKNQDINKLSWYLLRKSGCESDNIVFMISDTGIVVKPQ